MAVSSTRVTVVYRPKWGPDFIIRFYLAAGIVDPTNAGIVAILAALNSVTRAVAIEIELTQINVVDGSATASVAYRSVDKAQLNAIDEDGKSHNYKIPGPLAAILSANKETILLTATGVPAVVTAINTYCQGRGGADVTAVTSAHRTENRKRLKSAPRVG